jgi:prolyl-tRNA synthetase
MQPPLSIPINKLQWDKDLVTIFVCTMLQSQLFTKTQKEAPKDEKSMNAGLLVRAGFIDKLMTGVYSYLPLGLRVLKRIENIIRQEINAIGAQEILLPALHPKENWKKTGRWTTPEMFRLKSRLGKEYGLGWTHEEIITPLVQKFVHSYRDLPVFVYQIQDKFRDELRAKSGLLRGTEFIMKDLYSFHSDEKDLEMYYEKAKKAYSRIFKRCGLGNHTFITLASGGSFSKYSHEFQTITPYGEDEIYLCKKCSLGVNKEIIAEQQYRCPNCNNQKLEVKKAIEVGNIFQLKTKYTEAFHFVFQDREGKEKPVLMGCYGIGLGRLMGAIVEVHHDKKGIIWPNEVTPFHAHLISLQSSAKHLSITAVTKKLYANLQKQGFEVLYDDRGDKTAGEKFADADLIGIPWRIVVSEKTLKSNSVEIKQRASDTVRLVKITKVPQFFLSKIKM